MNRKKVKCMTVKEYLEGNEPGVRAFISNDYLNHIEDNDFTKHFGFPINAVTTEGFQDELEKWIKTHHGKKEIMEDYYYQDTDEEEVNISLVREMCISLYESNRYRYNTLWRTMWLEYNPIENNYKSERSVTTTNIGEQENTKIQGAQLNSNTVGSQSNTKTQGAQSNSKTIGSQSNTFTQGSHNATKIQGAQSNSFSKGAVSVTDIHGATSESFTKGEQVNETEYGSIRKDFSKGEQVNETAYGATSTSDTIGSIATSYTQQVNEDVMGARQHTHNEGAKHKNSDEARSLGKSAFDDVSEFGKVGIQTESGTNNYILQPNTSETPNGDGAYNPSEREYNEHVENEASYQNTDNDTSYTDTHTLGAHTDTVGSHTDTHTTQSHTDTLTEGSRSDYETVGVHTDEVTEGQRLDTKTTQAVTDTHSEVARTDGEDLGQREDTETYSQRSDGETLGQRADSESIGQREDSETFGQRTDNQNIGRREDTENLGEREDVTVYEYEMHGNVGTMSSQDMIKQERGLATLNLVEIISRDIIRQLCYTVY